MSDSRQRLGREGENIAEKSLVQSGYRIVERNYRCKLGEIDIIARDGEFLVFVEVKTRTGASFGSPVEAVNFRKQQQICKTALFYLSAHKLFDSPARFDVVAICIEKSGRHQIEHIPDAFDLCE